MEPEGALPFRKIPTLGLILSHMNPDHNVTPYECVSKSFRTDRLGQEQQMVQLSVIRCNCIAILWVSLVSFVATTLCVTS